MDHPHSTFPRPEWCIIMNPPPDLKPIFEIWDFSNPDSSREKFEELLEFADVESHASYSQELKTQIARTYSLTREFDEAHAILDALEPDLEDAPAIVKVRYALERGRTFNSSGERDKAEALFLRAWELARDNNLDGLAVDAAHMLGIVVAGESGIAWNLKALQLAETSRNESAKRWKGSLHNNLGWAYHDRGGYSDALEHFKRGYEFRKSRDEPDRTRVAKWAVARTLRSMDRFEQALEMQLELEVECDRANAPDGFVYEEIGELYLVMEDDRATDYFARAYPLLKALGWVDDERLERLETLGAID